MPNELVKLLRTRSDLMSPADRLAYYQATGERIGEPLPMQPPMQPQYAPEVRQTVDPSQVAQYMQQRQNELARLALHRNKRLVVPQYQTQYQPEVDNSNLVMSIRDRYQ